MSIIIRLQNLPWTANAEDIRQFFRELVIPDGGVHIVGGEHGDAFIVFGSDEDARQAMMKDGGQIKDVKVKLLLSSRVEMQKVIDMARQQALTSQNLIQTLASATRLEPSNMQVPLLPNMLTTLPALLNLAGMGALPALTTMPSAQTLPPMPNVAGLPTLSLPLTTANPPMTTPAQKMEGAKVSTTPTTQTAHADRNRNEKDVNYKNRSRSRSRSRDRGMNRDRHRYDEKSRDHKYGRDRSRSADRDGDSNRGRRRSRSRDRRNNDHNRDRDRHRSRDKKRDVSPSKGDVNGKDTLNQDSKFKAAETRDINKSDAMKFPWMQNNANDNKDARKTKSGTENNVNRLPGMMPSGMISPWILPFPNDKLTNVESRNPTLPTNAELTRAPFGVFPFGHGFSHAPSPVYPFAPFSVVPRPEVPREVRNFPAQTLPTQGFYQSQSAEGGRKDFAETSRATERRRPDSEQLENDVDSFGRQRRRIRKRSFSPERNNGEFHDRRDRYKFRDEGFGRSNYDEEDRSSRNSHDDMNRKSGYRRDFDRRERPDNRRPNFRDRFDNDASNESLSTNGNCVEVRNIPKDAKEVDIKKLFSPLPLYDSSIKFQFDHKGGRTKIAFIKFANSEHKMQALKYNGEVMNEYRVHVVHLEDIQWQTAENTVNVEVREPFLKISFIPKIARIEDIRQAFIDPPEEVVCSGTIDERESYTAFLRFSEKFPVQKALKNKHRILICDSRVKLEPSQEKDFLRAKNEEEGKVNGGKSRESSVESNRRPSSQQSDSNVKEDHSQSPTTEDDANKATLSCCVLLTNLPPDITNKDILNFFADVNALPDRIHIMFNGEGDQTGEVYCEFSSEKDVQNALQKNKCLFDDKSICVTTVSEEDVQRAVRPPPFSKFDFRSRAPHSGYRGRAPLGRPGSRNYGRGPFSRETPGVEDFGRPGCVLSMENVPYKADVEDIIDFFYDYDICRDDVIRRFNDFGLATGDARVCLRSPEDALRAYRELNRKKIQDRTIFLHLIP